MTGTETTILTIHDDGTRRVIEAALWKQMRGLLDPGDMTPLGTGIGHMEDAVLGRGADDFDALACEIDGVIRELTEIRTGIDRLRAARPGDRFDAPMAAEALREATGHLRDGIAEYDSGYDDGGLLAQPEKVRLTLIESYDAAARLLGELPQPAEVTA
jgi:hypothetical protein